MTNPKKELKLQPDQRITEILESITDAFYAVDADWRLTYVNHKTVELWQRCREDLVGIRLWDLFPNSERNFGYQELQRASRERIPIHFENYSPVLLTWVETNVYPTSDGGLSVYFHDISERKRAEEKIKAHFAILQGIIESNNSPIFSVDSKYCYTCFNKAHQNTMKALYGAEIALGGNIFGYLTKPEERLKTKINLDRTLGGERFFEEFSAGDDLSKRQYCEITYNPILDEDGNVVGAAVFARDRTAHKQAEEALNRSEMRFRSMFEKHQAMMMLIEPESGVINDANQAAVEFYGFPREQLCTMTIQEINMLAPHDVAAMRVKTLKNQWGHYIFPHRLADGRNKWVEVYSTPIDVLGKPLLFSIIHDITDRQLAAEELRANKIQLEDARRESEERYQNLFEKSPGAIILHDGNRLLAVNPATLALLGFERSADLIGTNVLERIHPEDWVLVSDWGGEIRNRVGASPVKEIRLIRKDGREVYVETVCGICHYHGQKAWQVIFHDFTARKRAEEALRISEGKYKSIVETAEEGIWIIDKNGRTNFVNSKTAALLGYQIDELLDKPVSDFVFDWDRDQLQANLQRRSRGIAERLDFRFKRSDGAELWVILNTTPLYDENGSYNGALAMLADITERKLVEQTLRESEDRYRAFFDNSIDAVLLTASNGDVNAANAEACKIFAMTEAEIIQAGRNGLTDQTDPRLGPALNERARTGRFKGEINYRRKDGTIFPGEVSSAFFTDRNGNRKTTMIIRDVTERKQAEEALRQSEERFRVLAEALPQLIWTADENGNINYINSRLSDYSGLNLADFQDWGWLKVIHPEDRPRAIVFWNDAIRRGTTYEIEYRMLQYNGAYRWFLGLGRPIRDKQGSIVYWFGTYTDVHYQKQLELSLQNSNARLHHLNKQMLTALEEERSAISQELHDEAGQALTALKIFLELMRDKALAETDDFQQQLDEAVRITTTTLEKVRHLARDLRPPALDALGLNPTLEDFCREFSKRVGLHIAYEGCEPPLLSGTARICLYRFLQEALTNIVKHAKADQVDVRLGYHNQQITLAVQDNGMGFIWDKNDGRFGKGMGLAGMQERLKMLEGWLTIDSQPGRGSLIIATIPWEGAR